MKSIKGRLFLWFFTFSSFFLIILSIFLYYKIKDIVFSSIDKTLFSKSQIITGLLHEEHGVIELELLEVVSGEYSMARSGHYYKVVMDGKILALSPSLVDYDFNVTSGTVQSSSEVVKDKVFVSTGPNNEPIRILQHDLTFLGKPVSVFVAESLEYSLYMINTFKHLLLIVIPISILIGGIVGLWITRRSLSPLDIFSLEVSQISYKNLDKRIDIKAHVQELRNLAESFNNMMDRLQKAFKAEYENERKKVAIETLKRLMVTLSHYLLNANMIIGGEVRHAQKLKSNKDTLISLESIMEQAKKIDAVIGSLKKITEIKTTDYTTKGHGLMIDITQEMEAELSKVKL